MMRISTLLVPLLVSLHLEVAFCAEATVSASVPETLDNSVANEEVDAAKTIEAGACLGEAAGDVKSDEKICNNQTVETSPRRLVENNRLETGYGEPQHVGDRKTSEEILRLIDETEVYMQGFKSDPQFASIKDDCLNRHESCSFWAVLGECEGNPGYMKLNCAPACKTCANLSYEHRCPFDPAEHSNVFEKPGDVNKMFERIVADPAFEALEPIVLARPDPTKDEMDKNVLDGPWMLMFDNFLSAEEADRLIELGADEGYERSADVGAKRFDGTYDKKIGSGRTSMNSWCQNSCETDPVTKDVVARIENVTHVPYNNSEWLQMLRYREGEYYTTHHDLIEHQEDRNCGVRILTLYMYLNDVEEGGGTSFPELGVTVTPKKGRAVLWPSVLDENPNAKDERTTHTALPVTKGVKFGSNAWLHQRDFKTANRIGCS